MDECEKKLENRMKTKPIKTSCWVYIDQTWHMLQVMWGWTFSMFKVTKDKYGNNFVNMIKTKPFCVFLLQLRLSAEELLLYSRRPHHSDVNTRVIM